jgi:hypothetical protein
MNSQVNNLERRAGQRFDMHIPVTLQIGHSSAAGFTQNLSARGALLYVDLPAADFSVDGNERIELGFVMPGEITHADSMRVSCLGTILRVIRLESQSKALIAVSWERCEVLPQAEEPSGSFARIASLHPHCVQPV